MACVNAVRRNFTRASAPNGAGGAGLIGNNEARTCESPVQHVSNRSACTAWPPRMRSVGATIAIFKQVGITDEVCKSHTVMPGQITVERCAFR